MSFFPLVRSLLILVGALSLAASGILFLVTGFGLIDYPSFLILGQSWIRTLASLAVIGCLALAVGFWDK